MLPKYKRILLKVSGESLMGDKSYGLDHVVIEQYARDIKEIVSLGVQVAIVIGGGNIYRGMNEAETGIERAHGDYMGMLATVINGMAVQAMLEKIGVFGTDVADIRSARNEKATAGSAATHLLKSLQNHGPTLYHRTTTGVETTLPRFFFLLSVRCLTAAQYGQ